MQEESLHPDLPEHETTASAAQSDQAGTEPTSSDPSEADTTGLSLPQHLPGDVPPPVDDDPDAGEAAQPDDCSSDVNTDGQKYEVIAGYKVHPLASRFPLIVGQEFDDLVEAAARARWLYPVETHDGLLLDGRNRLRVQEELRRRGIEIDVPVVEWTPTGDETVEEHIWAVNTLRRHLTGDQLAVYAIPFLKAIRAARQAKQEASRFGKNGADAAAAKSPPPDGQTPQQPRTSAEKDAASTIGGLAKTAGVSNHKARLANDLAKAVEKGEVSQSEIDAVAAGEKRLCDVVPSKAGGKKKPQTQKRDKRDDKVSDTQDGPSLPQGGAIAQPLLEAEIDRFWETLTAEIPLTEHRDMCRLLQQKIDAFKTKRGW